MKMKIFEIMEANGKRVLEQNGLTVMPLFAEKI